ncbi:MAG: factor-independent urate hydroxylase [Chloroflexota bacterium]
MIELGANRYGKGGIHIVRVDRSREPHVVRDVYVGVALEGDFGAAHREGDNALVVPTDTMKNTSFALAKDHLDGAIEAYAIALSGHFLQFPQVARATATVREVAWQPLTTSAGPSDHGMVRDTSMTRTTVVVSDRDGARVRSGVEDVALMKTTKSGFSGFPRDRFTTLPEVDDRMMVSKVTASWAYGKGAGDWDGLHRQAFSTLVDSFCDHFSPSLQNSIWIMGKAILERVAEVDEITMSWPNLHHWIVDLSPFGMDNDKVIYHATSEPYGMIEATVRRSELEAGAG